MLLQLHQMLQQHLHLVPAKITILQYNLTRSTQTAAQQHFITYMIIYYINTFSDKDETNIPFTTSHRLLMLHHAETTNSALQLKTYFQVVIVEQFPQIYDIFEQSTCQ